MKTLKIKRIACTSLLMLLFLLAPRKAAGMELQVSFNEVAQTADLIFIGTVVDQGCRLNDQQTMVFTDVYFDDISILYAAAGAVQKDNSSITLTYAGGFVEDYGVSVSGTPELETDQRYLIFTRDDGMTYSNPIVGGSQGLFEIMEDLVTGEAHVLTVAGRAVTGFDGDSITTGSDRILVIENGRFISEAPANIVNLESPPKSSDPGSSARASVAGHSANRPLPLARFIDHLQGKALVAPLGRRILKRGNEGKFYQHNGQKMEAKDLQMADPAKLMTIKELRQKMQHDRPGVPLAGETFQPASSAQRSTDSTDDGGMCYCGHQGPYLEMEQVPESWWAYDIQNYAMWSYNHFIDLYRVADDDGHYGINQESEFVGWLGPNPLLAHYGLSWGDALAYCVVWFLAPCATIAESDVIYNPAYSWTSDAEYAFTQTGVYLLLPVTMHELGHSWGAVTGTCDETYIYSDPTVMHRYSNVIEDGKGIHTVDAMMMRANYADSPALYNTDMGVESYYSSGHLEDSTTDQDDYYPGDSITLNNVTVENMTRYALGDVRLRFYLSTNTTITTSDYQLGDGAYWYWTGFSTAAYSVGDYQTTIPDWVPAGSYYVGAIVTINGFNNDHFMDNNATRFEDQINVIVDPPAAPTNVQATDAAYCDKVLVSWDASAGATEYRVIRSNYSISDWISGTTFEDDSAVENWVYSYTVKARNSGGESGYSAADAGSINTVPSAPTGVSASDGTYNYGVRITWNPVDNAEDYQVIRDMAVLSEWQPGAEFLDSTAESGVIYIYNVRARNACGDGGFSSPDEGHRGEGIDTFNVLVTGAGPAPTNAPTVRVFPPEQSAANLEEFNAYGAPQFGVNVSCGDVTGDGLDEILTGPGPGAIYGPQVRGFNISGNQLSGLNFMAYGTLKYGVNVAAGDIDGDGIEEIITGPGPGAVFGPHVRAFDANFNGSGCNVTPTAGVSFFSYGTLKWGVNVAAGDIDGDGMDEIVTGPGPGAVFGAHIRGWNVDGGQARPISGVSYFAYGTPRYGAVVTCGDIDGDGIDEIITAPGPASQFAAHIRGWNYDGSSLQAMDDINFFAWPSSQVRHGARIFSGRDLDGNGRDELIVGAGPDPATASPVKVYQYNGSQMNTNSQLFSLQAYPAGWSHGTNVAMGTF